MENATKEDRDSGLYEWAKVFKATTWEELKALSEKNHIIENTAVTMAELSENEKVREQLLREEKAERDKLSAQKYGFRQGLATGQERGFAALSQLIQLLLSSGRQDEIAKATSNMEYQKKLLEEFDLLPIEK